ncbi:RIO1 family regulatory kinase/ATPase, partial [Pyxidicoccus sp. 3LFB2]
MNDSLETLLADGIIEAVIGQLKTGKEAEVWLVQHAGQVVAAKLYKERHERNFRNNVGYREGREVRNSRTRRAMESGSRFGQAAAEDAWKSAESDSLYKLHAQGVRVPTPVLFYEGILLMELVLDAEGHPAPRLVEAPPATPDEAHALYLDLRSQVVNMLCADLIHGDLSPYNILMSWQGAIIIDFPQTVAAARNNRAEFYFRRDLDNVRNFLAGIAPWLYDAEGDTSEIWNAYVRRELTPDYTPRGNFRDAPRRGGAKGPRDGRQGFVPQPAPVELVPVAKSNLTPEEAAEAELRELEALVLKQGGGERGKPAAAPPPRGGRNRSGGGRPPPRAGGNRPSGAG